MQLDSISRKEKWMSIKEWWRRGATPIAIAGSLYI